jgi:hypothetical protein
MISHDRQFWEASLRCEVASGVTLRVNVDLSVLQTL